jgi:serine phosphatase RsbU (regulator of sigma subunit)
MEEGQFPLGLLPVSSFDGQRLEVVSGDLLVVATDGILEVEAPRSLSKISASPTTLI